MASYWVLVLVFTGYGRAGLDHIDFDSRESCEMFLAQVKDKDGWDSWSGGTDSIGGTCIEVKYEQCNKN